LFGDHPWLLNEGKTRSSEKIRSHRKSDFVTPTIKDDGDAVDGPSLSRWSGSEVR